MPIESPCTKVCVIEPVSGYCRGCGRSGAEIGGWIGYSAHHRQMVMALLPSRLANITGSDASQHFPQSPTRSKSD